MLKGFVSGEEKDIKRIPMKGKNLFDGNMESGTIRANGEPAPDSRDSRIRSVNFIEVEAGTYALTASANRGLDAFVFVYDLNGVFIERIPTVWASVPYTFTISNKSKIKFVFAFTPASDSTPIEIDDVSDIMLNLDGYQEGWEVRDNQDRLIWGREDELQTATGTIPFKGYALPVKVKSLLGNAVQNGTPSPQNIVTPEMCGVRTGNLWNYTIEQGGWLAAAGTIPTKTEPGDSLHTIRCRVAYIIPIPSNTMSLTCQSGIRINFVWINTNGVSLGGSGWRQNGSTVTAPEDTTAMTFILGKVDDSTCSPNDFQSIMLNAGSAALPYEPYGEWKIPFENHGENLFDASLLVNNMHLDITTGLPIAYTGRIASPDPVDVSQYSTVTISYVTAATTTNAMYSIFSNNELVGRFTAVSSGTVIDVSNADKMYICFYSTWGGNVDTSSVSDIMLNLGSTPKPYSPYLNATIPVYLGEVPTVRRVKKLVLDGTENWRESSDTNIYISLSPNKGVAWTLVLSTHFTPSQVQTNGNLLWFVNANVNFDTVEECKTYLASEYAAGHPVTLWYALATEQTAIVNEPLCKISTYADELTTIQAHGLSAPLYGIGDYKDTLNLSTGVVTRKVKKLVLDGTEEWVFAGDVARTIYLTLTGTYKAMDNSPAICTHYVEAASGDRIMITGDGRYLRIYDSSRRYANVDAWKTFLAQQYANGAPVIIWYILATTSTETVTVPTGMTGEIEGYLTQVGTPTPTNRSVPKWNGVEETGGTYAVTVYTPPEIPTTTGQNTLTVDSNLAPSKLEVSVHAKKIHYGFKIDKSNDDSESAVIYTHDAVTMTPAHMDFTNDRFDYGSWGNAFFVRDCYPVALNLDGTIAYRLDPDDYTKKTDGTASDIFYELLATAPSDWSTQWKQYYTKSGDEYVLNDQGSAPTFATDTYYKLTYNSSFTGNFMMAFPKVWFYRHEDSQYNYIEISNYKLSDDWKCYAHINASGQEVDFIYLPLFKGVIVNSKLRSLPGQIPQGNTTATDEVNAATALGSRWQIWDHSSVECLNDLLTLMSKSIDSQGRYGAGRSNAYNASDTVTYGKLQSGTLIKKGKFHGYSSGYKDVKVFGIESLWANRYDRIQGLLLANGVWKVKMTPPYNFTGTDFVTLSSASVPADVGYLSRVQTSEYGSIPAATISTSGKYFKDYFYKYANDTCVPLRGGNCADTDIAGYRFIYAGDPAWRTAWSFGASPVYK